MSEKQGVRISQIEQVIYDGRAHVAKGMPTDGKRKTSDLAIKDRYYKANNGFVDKFSNIWTKGPSRTKGEIFELDVQLSNQGREQLGWLSRDNTHINVSIKGIITHR